MTFLVNEQYITSENFKSISQQLDKISNPKNLNSVIKNAFSTIQKQILKDVNDLKSEVNSNKELIQNIALLQDIGNMRNAVFSYIENAIKTSDNYQQLNKEFKLSQNRISKKIEKFHNHIVSNLIGV